ncbi:hypothetical protein CVT26_004022 [Gymnopilus dilepis]|uniref:Uncharacterized protein n=1 Tax=Gymnopilus dilepis TaxID=231916 RepID=A0A409W239_9AGAR|nr:hypothetical protein CVT26_004022 [Gymnopilus dilepis]
MKSPGIFRGRVTTSHDLLDDGLKSPFLSSPFQGVLGFGKSSGPTKLPMNLNQLIQAVDDDEIVRHQEAVAKRVVHLYKKLVEVIR